MTPQFRRHVSDRAPLIQLLLRDPATTKDIQTSISVSAKGSPEMAETSDFSTQPGGNSPHSTGTVTNVTAIHI